MGSTGQIEGADVQSGPVGTVRRECDRNYLFRQVHESVKRNC